MKITPPFHSAGNWETPKPAGHGGKSFAELIESGESAKSITDHRALSFSESGLLGRPFTAEGGSEGLKGHPKDIPEQAAPTSPEVAHPAEIAASRQPGPSPRSEHSDAFSTSATAQNPEDAPPAGGPELLVTVAAGPPVDLPEAPDLSHFVDRLNQVLKDRTASAAGPRLTLRGNSAGLTVIVGGMHLADKDRIEIDAIIHRVAKEYGVTVRQIMVIQSISAGGNQRGGGQWR